MTQREGEGGTRHRETGKGWEQEQCWGEGRGAQGRHRPGEEEVLGQGGRSGQKEWERRKEAPGERKNKEEVV